MIRNYLFLLCLVAMSTSLWAQAPKSAKDLMAAATKQAAKEDKNVFVIFHASWCGWCKKMDKAILSEECKQLFEDNYVFVHLTVAESGEKKKLENPGAEALLKKYNGADAGLPFWLIFDKDGKLLADCQVREKGVPLSKAGENVGCPAQPEEVEFLVEQLKKTSKLKPEQLDIIAERFSRLR